MKKPVKIASALIVSLLSLGLLTGVGGYAFLKKSLPLLSGFHPIKKLTAPVQIDRDDLGIPTINAANRLDVARALGFLHAQDRYFQMDLMRRAASGELSELFGREALEFDKERRVHRFRDRAKLIYDRLNPNERQLLIAYAEGVNEGFAALSARPFEYFFLQILPKPWSEEDSILVCLGLYFELQDGKGEGNLKRAIMKKYLSEEVYTFFVKNGSRWEASLDGSRLPMLPIPKEESFSYLQPRQEMNERSSFEPLLGGSNQWAVTGSKTSDGKALLACDMHLQLSMPNIWYRAAFNYFQDDNPVHISGVTLPGAPMMVIGSNTHIAWGFTNAQINTSTIAAFDPETAKTVHEKIHIKGEEPYDFYIREDKTGPVIGEFYALRWVAHEPDALNFQLLHLESAKNVDEALAIAKEIKIPVLNFMVADRVGDMAWTLVGDIPNVDRSVYPTLINPASGTLCTANNRTLGGEWLERVGQESFLNGIRAFQICENLNNLQGATPKKMLDLQMEITAPFFERWQNLLIETLKSAPQNDKRNDLLKIVEEWDNRACKESAAYFWIRKFREHVSKAILERVLCPCLNSTDHFLSYFQDFEEPVWMIASEQPAYLVDPDYKSWNEELISYIDAMCLDTNTIQNHVWGDDNKLFMKHPFTGVVPGLSYFLDMPAVPVSGDYYVPKVLYRNQGASQRMIVSPGLESEGIFQMPGGQSSHPLSPFYRAGHEAWLKDEPSPFLPGKPVYTLTLQNESDSR